MFLAISVKDRFKPFTNSSHAVLIFVCSKTARENKQVKLLLLRGLIKMENNSMAHTKSKSYLN